MEARVPFDEATFNALANGRLMSYPVTRMPGSDGAE